MPSFYTIIRSRKLVLRPVKYVPNIQWKQWESTWHISMKTTNIGILKIAQYLISVICDCVYLMKDFYSYFKFTIAEPMLRI